jgi:excisionase family DNA binding protein
MRPEKLHAGISAMSKQTQLWVARADDVPVPDELLTRADVARICKVSPLTIIRLEQAGKLEVLRLGAGSVRIRRSSLEKFLTESITHPTAN